MRFAGPLDTLLTTPSPANLQTLTGIARINLFGINALPSALLTQVLGLLRLDGSVIPRFDPLAVSIREQKIVYDQALRLELGSAALFLAGSVGFDGKLDMSLGIPLLPDMLGGIPLIGQLPSQLEIPLRGVAGAPALLLDEALAAFKRLLPGR
jgi:hypothetical protein